MKGGKRIENKASTAAQSASGSPRRGSYSKSFIARSSRLESDSKSYGEVPYFLELGLSHAKHPPSKRPACQLGLQLSKGTLLAAPRSWCPQHTRQAEARCESPLWGQRPGEPWAAASPAPLAFEAASVVSGFSNKQQSGVHVTHSQTRPHPLLATPPSTAPQIPDPPLCWL